ncbi:MAG: hypothetical protein AB1Z98_38355 [Nannocystaceae bacterium]
MPVSFARLRSVALLGLVSLGLAACVHSGLNIPAGERFELEGGQSAGYRATIDNVGKTPVDLVLRTRTGERVKLRTLEPGSKTKARARAGDTLVIENPSSSKARLDVDLRGDTNVGMAYSTVPAAED